MRISPSYCPTCGGDPCTNPSFCAQCRKDDERSGWSGASFFGDGPEPTPHPGPDPQPAPGPNGHGPAIEPLPWANIPHWDTRPTPSREWSVLNRVPLRHVTLFTGEGAIGKSLTELQLAVAHVFGTDWLGSMPEPGSAIYFGAEDEQDEIERRLVPMLPAGSNFAALARAGMHILPYYGKDATLAVPDRRGRLEATPLYYQLLEAAADIRPKHFGIDTSADVFGGNELDRGQVKQFVRMLAKIAIAANGGLVLLAHPSLTGINTGSGISGSTGWHNSVRARMYQTQAEGDDENLRELTFLKNNYGPRAEKVLLRWQNGLFVPVSGGMSPEQHAAERKVDDMFMILLAKLASRGQHTSDKSGTTYAPAHFAKQPEAKLAKVSNKQFADAMVRLLSTGKIHVHWEGSQSRRRSWLMVGSGGVQPDLLVSTDPSTDPSTDLPPPSTACVTTPPVPPLPVEGGEGPGGKGPPLPPGETAVQPNYRGLNQNEHARAQPQIHGGLLVVGLELGAACVQCGRTEGVVYLIRNQRGGDFAAQPLHEDCAAAWFEVRS
jgi:RecA-family ATPase